MDTWASLLTKCKRDEEARKKAELGEESDTEEDVEMAEPAMPDQDFGDEWKLRARNSTNLLKMDLSSLKNIWF